jgi:hypothetical protein
MNFDMGNLFSLGLGLVSTVIGGASGFIFCYNTDLFEIFAF